MVPLAVPDDPSLAMGTVPEFRLVAFRLPLNDVAVNVPEDGIKDNLVEDIFCGIVPAAVTQVGNTDATLVTSSVIATFVADPALPVTLPLMVAVTVKPVKVPTEVIFGWAAVVTVPAVVAVAALPNVFWFKVGTSVVAIVRNAGTPIPDAGPAKKVAWFWLAKAPVRVPVPVTGELVTVNMAGNASPTEVTVPAPEAGVCQVGLPDTTVNTCPLPPAAGTFAST